MQRDHSLISESKCSRGRLTTGASAHTEDSGNKSAPCLRGAHKAELRFSILVFPLQRRFALIDLDRD